MPEQRIQKWSALIGIDPSLAFLPNTSPGAESRKHFLARQAWI